MKGQESVWMEFMCRFDINKPLSLCGRHSAVDFLGDDVQLPSFCDTPVYTHKNKISAAMHGSLV